MTQYRLNDPRQGAIGPIGLETAKDLVNAGVIGPDVMVSKDGGPYRPITELRELWYERRGAGTAPTYAGDIGRNSFFKVFSRFHWIKATGLLVIVDAPRQRDIYLEAGQPVFVASNIDGDRLGEFLLEKEYVEPAQLESALDRMQSTGSTLGHALVELGAMPLERLYVALREQQRWRLLDLCSWQKGQYLFFENELYAGQKIEIALDASELITEAARRMPLRDIGERLATWRTHRVVRRPAVKIDHLRFTPVERQVLERIDGRRTFMDIANGFGEAEQRAAALAVVYLLYEVDGIQFESP